MATADQPTPQPNQALDPAQLGADTQPALTPEDDSHDMSTVMADADTDEGRPFTAKPATQQGSEFAEQRRQGAEGDTDAPVEDVGHAQGMGRTGSDGDEDRGYDQSGLQGGLGSSGGREDLSERQPATDQNPFTGGYDGGGQHQPPASQTEHLGLNTPSPTND
ncbi:MAG: hypothetical protein ACRYFZ_09955 [Janthinobacterium lividum]